MCNKQGDKICPTLPNRRYNPLNEVVQRDIIYASLGLKFVCANECEPGGPDVVLKPPTLLKSIEKKMETACFVHSCMQSQVQSESQLVYQARPSSFALAMHARGKGLAKVTMD